MASPTFYIILFLVGLTNSVKIRMMTLNTWNCGSQVENGLSKIVRIIKRNSADIVALQEITNAQCFISILQKLGSEWHGFMRVKDSYPDNAIVSKFGFDANSVEEFGYAVGATVFIPVKKKTIPLTVVSAHFQWRSYGPYAACNKLVTAKWQLSASERSPKHTGRLFNLQALKKMKLLANSTKKTRVIVAGDFNTPSHLDWTKNLRNIHCNWSYAWPVTKNLGKQLGLIDSFRQVHPDILKYPGITWSPIYKKYVNYGDFGMTIPEPQDRIDFIFYKGKGIRPTKSFVYEGKSKQNKYMPNHQNNVYPSDHAAVITEFEIQ